MLQMQYKFTLPKGYMDEEGSLHKNGIMRPTITMDGIRVMGGPRVIQNLDYTAIIVLSHVIIELNSFPLVTVETTERLFASDPKFLQEMYGTLNELEGPVTRVACPYCGRESMAEMGFKGQEF